jgi:hypothetical protein
VSKRIFYGVRNNRKRRLLSKKYRGSGIANIVSRNTNDVAFQLKRACPVADVCMAFGKEYDRIKKFFNNFVDFTYVKNIRKIGNPSANGFVREFTYERDGYKTYAVLKSSMDKRADNLYYEYIVGKFINTQTLKFPNFVKTYGVYYYPNTNKKNNMISLEKNNNNIPQFLSDSLIKIQDETTAYDEEKEKYLLNFGCAHSDNIALLCEHIRGESLDTMLRNTFGKSNRYFFWGTKPMAFPQNSLHELLYILFQVYFALNSLRKVYTHYDLHLGNVLVYEPENGKYIEYHYNIDGHEITFKSRYIAKIIDYGRSYFDNQSQSGKFYSNSIMIQNILDIDNLDTSHGCKENGKNNGFEFMPNKKNISSDLLLLSKLKTHLEHYDVTDNEIYKLTQRVKFTFSYSTPEINDTGLTGRTLTINNVTDAFTSLKQLVIIENNTKLMPDYTKLIKLGTMIIDGKNSVTYVKSN